MIFYPNDHRSSSVSGRELESQQEIDGGGGEIRTPESLRIGGLVNRCTRPLCDSSNGVRPAGSTVRNNFSLV